MSATGRGAEVAPSEFYPTPPWCVRRILERLALPGGAWLEPAAGDAAIVRAVNEIRGDVTWSACELREECRGELQAAVAPLGSVAIGDFLRAAPSASHNVAILNPPFSLALRFIERCLGLAGWVIALERLNWLEGEERHPFLTAHAPDVYVLPNRPSFTGNGTDSITYAWFVWPPGGHDRHAGAIEVLPTTPAAERKAAALRPDLYPSPRGQLSLVGGG